MRIFHLLFAVLISTHCWASKPDELGDKEEAAPPPAAIVYKVDDLPVPKAAEHKGSCFPNQLLPPFSKGVAHMIVRDCLGTQCGGQKLFEIKGVNKTWYKFLKEMYLKSRWVHIGPQVGLDPNLRDFGWNEEIHRASLMRCGLDGTHPKTPLILAFGEPDPNQIQHVLLGLAKSHNVRTVYCVGTKEASRGRHHRVATSLEAIQNANKTLPEGRRFQLITPREEMVEAYKKARHSFLEVPLHRFPFRVVKVKERVQGYWGSDWRYEWVERNTYGEIAKALGSIHGDRQVLIARQASVLSTFKSGKGFVDLLEELAALNDTDLRAKMVADPKRYGLWWLSDSEKGEALKNIGNINILERISGDNQGIKDLLIGHIPDLMKKDPGYILDFSEILNSAVKKYRLLLPQQLIELCKFFTDYKLASVGAKDKSVSDFLTYYTKPIQALFSSYLAPFDRDAQVNWSKGVRMLMVRFGTSELKGYEEVWESAFLDTDSEQQEDLLRAFLGMPKGKFKSAVLKASRGKTFEDKLTAIKGIVPK